MCASPADRPLATYEDLGYRDVFWAERRYEDACDRLALRALLPPEGERLLEVGAGFGRLAAEYRGYQKVVLLDSSEVHLEAARRELGGDPRYQVVGGDAFALPFETASFDAAVCVRVLHHFEDPAPALAELGRVVRPGGMLVVEFANKRNLKAIGRYLLRRQTWSPFAPGPARYRPYHYNHAPRSVRRWLRDAGFSVERMRAASLFRLPLVSRHVPVRLLATAESILQGPLGPLTPGPSVFVAARRRERSP